MVNQREMSILEFFIKNSNSSYEELAEVYNISERIVRYNIKNINYFLQILNLLPIQKQGKKLYFDNKQDISNIYSVIKELENFSQIERIDILKFVISFDENGLNLKKISEKLKVSKTTIKKDLKLLKQNINNQNLELVYKNTTGYRMEGELYKKKLFNIYILRKYIGIILKNENTASFNKVILELFSSYFPLKNMVNIKNMILNIQKKLKLNISDEVYEMLYSYILSLLNEKITGNKNNIYKSELNNKIFIESTNEFVIIKEELEIYAVKENLKFQRVELLELTDFFLGITTNNLYFLENWINEEILIKKIINEFNKYVNVDVTNDKILFECLAYHIKPAIYRIKKHVIIKNPIFKELTLNNDPILEITKKVISSIEEMLEIKFPMEEIALLGYHFKASIDRNTYQKTKRILLVCGLGYGSSRLLEQSIKKYYNVDVVDILSYYMIEDALENYKNIDLILTTMDIENKYEIPVVQINPLLKEEDFNKISKYDIPKNDNKILLSKIVEIVSKKQEMSKLIEELKSEFSNKIIDDLSYTDIHIKDFISEKNVMFVDKVENWEEAVRLSGDLLKNLGCIKEEYKEEMVDLVKKFGSYIVIEDRIAIPHAGISTNVLKMGIGVLVVKNAVEFPGNKKANIFISFAIKESNSHLNILNDLFNLITKYQLRKKLTKVKDKNGIIDYFTKLKFEEI